MNDSKLLGYKFRIIHAYVCIIFTKVENPKGSTIANCDNILRFNNTLASFNSFINLLYLVSFNRAPELIRVIHN